MPQQAVLPENFYEYAGVDYRSNDATRRPNFARDTTNVEYLADNSLGARAGCKIIAPSQGGGGIAEYIKRDEKGIASSETLCIADRLYRYKKSTLTVTYSGLAVDPSLVIEPRENAGVYYFAFVLQDTGIERLVFDLGNGLDDATPPTIGQLITAINALSGYSASATGTTTVAAASLPITNVSLSAAVALQFGEWQEVYCPVSTPFATFWSKSGTDTFKLADFQNIGNRLFIATGETSLFKYDGVSAYKAGMPSAGFDTQYAAAISGAVGAGSLTGTFTWAITYSQHDSARNIIEGDRSNEITLTLSAEGGDITIPYLQPASGFLTSCATFNNGGTESGTTLTVDSGHTLQIGQTAFFKDNSGVAHERTITAVAATTITISGASVTVPNDGAVSANLRIRIYRTKAGGSQFYLVNEIPNNSLTSSITYTDTKADSSLIELYVPPINGHGLPPDNLWSLTGYQQSLCGATLRDDQFYVSDPSGPEYFGRSQVDEVRSSSNYPISALGANREVLVIFKPDEIHVMQGVLPDGNYTLEKLTDGNGTDSKDSVVDVDGTLWFWSTFYGAQRIQGNRLPEDIGYRVLPIARQFTNAPPARKIVTKRVVSVDISTKQQVLFFLPNEDSSFNATEDSILLLADYRSQFDNEAIYDERGIAVASVPKIRWWRWDYWNLGGGALEVQGKLTWQERRYSNVISVLERSLVEQLSTGDNVDVTDHAKPVSWRYEWDWDDLGNIEILKKFRRYIIYSFTTQFAPNFSVRAKAEIRWENGSSFSEKTIDFGSGISSGFGTGPFGIGPFGDPAGLRRIFPLRPNKAQSVKLILEKELWKERPAISGVVLEAVPSFQPKAQRGNV